VFASESPIAAKALLENGTICSMALPTLNISISYVHTIYLRIPTSSTCILDDFAPGPWIPTNWIRADFGLTGWLDGLSVELARLWGGGGCWAGYGWAGCGRSWSDGRGYDEGAGQGRCAWSCWRQTVGDVGRGLVSVLPPCIAPIRRSSRLTCWLLAAGPLIFLLTRVKHAARCKDMAVVEGDWLAMFTAGQHRWRYYWEC